MRWIAKSLFAINSLSLKKSCVISWTDAESLDDDLFAGDFVLVAAVSRREERCWRRPETDLTGRATSPYRLDFDRTGASRRRSCPRASSGRARDFS
jgi:hypothetical protein